MNAVASRGRGRPRDPDQAEKKRCAILDAAARMFARSGYGATDVQDIARKAGVAKGTVYYHFDSKEELFLATVDSRMQELLRSVESSMDEDRDPLDTIRDAVTAYLSFFDRHPDCVELLIQERAVFRDRKMPTYFRYKEANTGPWKEMYVRLMRDGIVRQMPVDRILDVIGDLLYGTIFTNHFAGRKKSLKSQSSDLVDVFFNGILTNENKE